MSGPLAVGLKCPSQHKRTKSPRCGVLAFRPVLFFYARHENGIKDDSSGRGTYFHVSGKSCFSGFVHKKFGCAFKPQQHPWLLCWCRLIADTLPPEEESLLRLSSHTSNARHQLLFLNLPTDLFSHSAKCRCHFSHCSLWNTSQSSSLDDQSFLSSSCKSEINWTCPPSFNL